MNSLGFAAIAAGIILYALFAKRLETTVITPPLVFAVFGLVVGESVLGWADLSFENHFIHGLAEITLILVLFSDAARIDRTFQLVLARPASDREIDRALAFVERTSDKMGVANATSDNQLALHAWSGFCQALIGSAEFRYID